MLQLKVDALTNYGVVADDYFKHSTK